MATIEGKYGGSESLVGTPQDDIFLPYTGVDTADGGDGLDVVVIGAPFSEFEIVPQGAFVYVSTVSGASSGADQLRMKNIERLQFNDINVALDMGLAQSGGEALLLMGAATGPAALANKPLTGSFVRFFDGGKNLLDGANLLVDTGIMAALAGGADNTHFVNYVFHNVTGVAPDSATLASFVSLLDSHALTQAQMLVAAAQSTQNQTHVNLVGLTQTGLLFL